MPRTTRRSTGMVRLAFTLASIASVAGAVPVRAQAPSTLTGETLAGTTSSSVTSGDCRTDENVSLTYTMSGTAVGPYPGPFTEVGTLNLRFVGPPEARLGVEPIDRSLLDATFEIDSSAGVVTGAKILTAGRSGFALCTATGELLFSTFEIAVVYIATIETSEGVFVDRGIASGPLLTSGDQVTITENFDSSFEAPLASRSECKDVRPFFVSQQQCVQAFKADN